MYISETMTNQGKKIAPSHMILLKKIVARFLRLNIAQKMYIGFLPLMVFLVLVSTFALTKLSQLTNLNESVLVVDIPIQDTVRQMQRTVIDQESVLQRFIILRDEAFLKIFANHNSEFIEGLNDLKSLTKLSADPGLPLVGLEKAYTAYADAQRAKIKQQGEPAKKSADFDRIIRDRQTALLDILTDIASLAKSDQNEKAGISASFGSIAFKFALALCVIGIALSATVAALVTNNIVKAVKKLHRATEEISQGNFDHLPDIKNKDELGDLAKAFVEMGKRLINLEEMYLDASPLTRLPGGVAIENMLKKRVKGRNPFAFCQLDIDNFKSFNDHYGYAQGNGMIQTTATIIEEITDKHGTADDFVGHIGGDDFVLITTPDKYENICRRIIDAFDEQIPKLYSVSDRHRGYLAGENRQGEKINFPLATISIAVVTNQDRVIDNHIEVGEIAAEIKELSKSIARSSMVTDHRRRSKDPMRDVGKLIRFPGQAQ